MNSTNLNFIRLAATLLFMLALSLLVACGSAEETTNTYSKARPAADEAAIVITLKTIANAQQTYFARSGSSYGTFDQLVESGALDGRFRGSAPVVGGYVFKMNVAPSPGGQQALTYSVNADPQPAANRQTTGTRHYFMDSNSVIHYNESQTASANDPSLQ